MEDWRYHLVTHQPITKQFDCTGFGDSFLLKPCTVDGVKLGTVIAGQIEYSFGQTRVTLEIEMLPDDRENVNDYLTLISNMQ